MSRQKHEVTLFLHSETANAWLVGENANHSDRSHVWLPKSQCDEVRQSAAYRKGTTDLIGTQITLDVPEWLLQKNKLDGLV